MDFFNDNKTIFILIGGLLLIVAYSMVSVLINKLNDAIHGKITVLAWVPVTNVYLLGKLVVNKIMGILLAVLLLYGIIIAIDIHGLEVLQALKLPASYVVPYLAIYALMIFLLVVVGKSKLNKIIREGTGNDEMSRFIAKDYDDKEPVVTETPKPKEIQEGIKDDYQYNHTSLSDLSKLNNNNSDKNNP